MIFAEDSPWLLIPADPQLIERLSVYQADIEDREIGDPDEEERGEPDNDAEDDDPDEWDARIAWEPVYRSENDQRLPGKKWD